MSIDQEYKDFSKWCRDNPAYDLDPRLHTHSGRINDGGYILHKRTGTAFKAWQASREALEGEAIGYVVPRMLEAMLAGKYCGISMSAEPKEDGIAVYTHPASDDATECPYPCGWSDLQSIAIRKAAFIARSAEDDIGTPFEDIRQAGSELGRIAIKLCSLAIKQEQKS